MALNEGPRRVVGFVLLLAISAALLCIDLGKRVFATNDEARFPMLARDILANGEWWLPRLNGVPHLNKPPLHAWLIAVTAWPADAVTEWNAVLPSIVAALAVVVLTYWIASRLFDIEVAIVSALTVVTMAGVFTLARVPLPDMTLCAALTAAIAAFAAAEFAGWRHGVFAFYAVVAAAFWVKGPVVFLALAVVVVHTLATHGTAGWARLRSWPGLILLVVLPLPWWLAGALAGHEAFGRDIVLNDFLLWYLPVGKWTWRQVTDPVVQAATILLPWTIVLPFAVRWAVSEADPARRNRARLLIVWMAVIFCLVAISQEQRWRYYLPLCPPASMLIAAWYSQLPLRRRAVWFIGAWSAVAVALSLGHGFVLARRNATTDLRTALPMIRATSAPVYAVDVPELVFAFYAGRPVRVLADYRGFESLAGDGQPRYLIVADRAAPRTRPVGLRRVGGGAVNARQFSVFESH